MFPNLYRKPRLFGQQKENNLLIEFHSDIAMSFATWFERKCLMEQKVITSIFDSWNETIIWYCLQDVMGEIHTNSEEDAAMAILGDFAFFAGKPSEEML